MKKNVTSFDDEIDFLHIIKLLLREKVLISSISIIFGFLGYLYASFQPQKFKIEITIKEPYIEFVEILNRDFGALVLKEQHSQVSEKFISDFKSNLLSLNNLKSFVEESKEFDNFKEYLKLRNISVTNYFLNNIGEVKEKNVIIRNKYFLAFTKELDGDIFFNNYLEFVKKKTAIELKKNLQLLIVNKIVFFERAFQLAKSVNIESPIGTIIPLNHNVIASSDLIYKGSKILSLEIVYLKELLVKLENEQFNFQIILDKSSITPTEVISNHKYFAAGLILGLFLSLVIIFFKSILKNN
jgi:hypothetical protein